MNIKNKIFLFLCYVSSLIVGLLALPIILFQPMVFGGTFFIPIIPTFFLFCLGLMTYSCFNNFNIKDRTILLLTISVSAIISVASYALHYVTNSILRSLTETFAQLGQDKFNSLFSIITLFNPNELPNIIIFIVIIFVAYNIFPVISLVKGKK